MNDPLSGSSGGGGSSAFDMSRFHQVFFEEAAEHLANLENLLVGIDVGTPDPDDLDAIFRAAHSIKGGSGTFGFEEMTEVTHELESLLDRVRKHELALSLAMVDVLLAARDLLCEQLAHCKGEAGAPATPVAAMCERIRVCMKAAEALASAPALRDLELAFTVPPGGPSDLTGLFAELGRFGTVEELAPAGEAGEAGERRLPVVTAAANAELVASFGFILDPATVVVRPFVAPAALAEDPGFGFFGDAPGAPAASAPAPAEDPGYGFFEPLPAAQAPVAERTAAVPAPASPGRGPAGGTAPAEPVESSIRVGVNKVDALINLVGELVITQAMLAQNVARLDPVLHEKLLNGIAQLDRNTRDLQESVMSIRMLPISSVFSRFPRVVRDLAGKLGKQVELKTEGEATELDKGMIEKLSDPLTHLVRNSLDHGVEAPDVRAAAGKPAKGTITLRAFHRGGNIMIEVIDDGAGLDRERLLAKARERGMKVADTMTDQEVYQLIFEAGFSTAATVTDVSGRGVGMDVVRRNIREMGGSVDISSGSGTGTRISIRLPLTLAILDGMSVGVGSEVFIIPLTHIVESLQPSKAQVSTIAGRGSVVQVRGEYLPVLALHEVFNLRPAVSELDRGILVILESDGAKTALFVDALLGQHQVVIKSLESNYRRVAGVSGATIMGDGRVALIVDVAGLIATAQRDYAKAA